MKKNIIIGLLVIVTLFSITYGTYQKIRADRNEAKAIKLEIIAKMLKKFAEMNTKKSLEQQRFLEQQKRKIVENEHKKKQKK
jgi:Tfp pilus assembly protein PilE